MEHHMHCVTTKRLKIDVFRQTLQCASTSHLIIMLSLCWFFSYYFFFSTCGWIVKHTLFRIIYLLCVNNWTKKGILKQLAQICLYWQCSNEPVFFSRVLFCFVFCVYVYVLFFVVVVVLFLLFVLFVCLFVGLFVFLFLFVCLFVLFCFFTLVSFQGSTFW